MRRSFVVAILLLAAACSTDEPAPPAGRGEGLVAQVASYEPVAGAENRIIVGLLTEDNLFVSGGEATFVFEPDGGEAGAPAPAAYLPIVEPGAAPAPPRPTVGPASQVGRGVYAAYDVAFDRPGPWQVEVSVEVDGEPRSATAAFNVLEEPQVPGVGEKAPATENPTVGAEDAPIAAIDSRASTGGEVPDPEMHDTTIASLVRKGRPFLAVFATPVYCVSQFCGPITDMVDGLRRTWGERLGFVHVEIWRDFQGQVVNEAAAEWLQTPDGGLTEPWIFLVDRDGRIVERWDNVATPQEIEPHLEALAAD